MEAEREDRKQREALREEERKRLDERRRIEQEKLVCTFVLLYVLLSTKVKFRRRISHKPNQMQMRKIFSLP